MKKVICALFIFLSAIIACSQSFEEKFRFMNKQFNYGCSLKKEKNIHKPGKQKLIKIDFNLSVNKSNKNLTANLCSPITLIVNNANFTIKLTKKEIQNSNFKKRIELMLPEGINDFTLSFSTKSSQKQKHKHIFSEFLSSRFNSVNKVIDVFKIHQKKIETLVLDPIDLEILKEKLKNKKEEPTATYSKEGTNYYFRDSPEEIYIRGHYRSNGTYVDGYYKTSPNHTTKDNWSHSGNTNPYSGKKGYKKD